MSEGKYAAVVISGMVDAEGRKGREVKGKKSKGTRGHEERNKASVLRS